MNESRIVRETLSSDMIEIGMTRDKEQVRVTVTQHENDVAVAHVVVLFPRFQWAEQALYMLDMLGYAVDEVGFKPRKESVEADEASGYRPISTEEEC